MAGHKKKSMRELLKLLHSASKNGFIVGFKKSGSISIKSSTNKDQMYLIHPGDKALDPVKKFIQKNS